MKHLKKYLPNYIQVRIHLFIGKLPPKSELLDVSEQENAS